MSFFIVSAIITALGVGVLLTDRFGKQDAKRLEAENHDLKADLASARSSIDALIEAGDAIIDPPASRWTATQTEQEAAVVDLTAYRLNRVC